jgi:crotonobetainyl-CoA:carnitine CoA-transferase CaiB-like acyl-CoA transferase
MPGACADLRVLDLSTGLAGPMATMILADFGAEVIRVEPPGGDAGWEEPVYLLLNRGKKSIALDVLSPSGSAEVQRLVRGIDVIVETMRPGDAEAAGIGYDALSAPNPGLVYCSITGFGSSGPLARVKPDDALVMAKAGIFRDQPGWHHDGVRPVFRASRDASYFAGMLAVQGIVAALRARDLTGKGQLVETSLLKALTCRQNPKVRWLLREGEDMPAESGPGGTEVQGDKHVLPHHLDPREVSLIGMRVECKDGRWIVHSHTEPHFFPAWIEVIGLGWIWQEDRFKGAPYRFSDPDAKLELIHLIEQRMKEKTGAEWMDAYVANGNVCGDVVQTTQEALRHRQVVEAGHVVTVEDPRVGPIVQIGALAKLPGAPAVVHASAPIPGQHTDAILKAEVLPSFVSSPRDATLAGPLEGITIVEAAYYYATPFATALLAELGARVIKIEPLRGDPYRALASAGVGDPVLNLGHNNMVRAMQGKESIALNLKDPRGREILHRLVARADAFVHSFRLGVPESLGIDYETLRKINPQLVYQYGASYGSVGPYCRQPAIDPVIAAFAGTTAYQAGEGNLPLTETGADPIAAAGHASAMMLGLLARHRTGKGQFVESAMIVSNLYLNCEDALAYDGKPPRSPVDGMQLGTGATYRLYETASVTAAETIQPYENPDPHWVFLAAVNDDEFARLCSAAGRDDICADPRFATRRAREANDPALAALLEGVFDTKTAHAWETSLLAAGVGCVTADAMSHFAFLYCDAQARAIDMMATAEHPSFGGRYWRHAPLIRLSTTPGRAPAFCEMGEHTRTILDELGYDEAVMAQLEQAGVVTWPAGKVDVLAHSSPDRSTLAQQPAATRPGA